MRRPRIFYFAYDHQKPTGGQKSVYRHVEILRDAGYEAYVLHLQPGFRLTWFSNSVPVVNQSEFHRLHDPLVDYVTVPEDLGPKILTFQGKKVINNQGAYLGFYSFGFDAPQRYPYLHPDVRAVFVKSEFNAEYLRFAFPTLPLYRIYNSVDPEAYRFCPLESKKLTCVCPAHKNRIELAQVYNLLKARSQQGLNACGGLAWVFVDSIPEREVARLLKESALFLFLSTIEGFGRMPIEAMMSGCLVVAYDIPPLNEYLNTEWAFLSPRGDVRHVVQSIEEICALLQSGTHADLSRMAQKAGRSALLYSPAHEQDSVLAAWKAVLDSNS
jgi:glycosyltransferase involved in cell wall biosynthesis